MLTFVIPTYNRTHTLERAIRSIAEQAPAEGVQIKVIAHNSPEATHRLLDELEEEFPILSWRILEAPRDYSEAFFAMFQEAPGSDWVWTFGDDDYLLPGALEFMLKQLALNSDLQFVHVAEKGRASGNNGLYRGKLLDLCNTFGWLEMTGFITGNICRGARLAHAAQSPRWMRYAKSAFVQSAALLEELRDDQCALMEIPVIDTQRQEVAQDTLESWVEQRIDFRYQFAGNCIETMLEEGVLTQKVKPKFFRYLSYHLWDRFISHFVSDYLLGRQLWDEGTWERIRKLALFIDDEEYAKKLHEDIDKCRGLTLLHSMLSLQLTQMDLTLQEIGQRRNQFPYPYSFTEKGKPEVGATRPEQTVAHHPV